MRPAVSAVCFAAILAAGGVADAADPPSAPAAFRTEPLGFEALDGWAADDHKAAFAAFRRSCTAVAGEGATRAAHPPDPALIAVCATALAGPNLDPDAARGFFEAHFTPVEIVPESGSGFLTGYFEPEYGGSLARSDRFATPLLARPDDLVDRAADATQAGFPPGLAAAQRGPSGLEPYPDRAAIEEGALGERARPIVFLADPVEAFIVQVQGSARIRLDDGRVLRVAFAGRNGQPYTSIGRVLSEREGIPPAEMGLQRLTAWLHAHPDEARDVMRLNRSYIFFRVAQDLAPEEGPIGGAGIPLTAGRSLAIDRSVWSYGLPVWLEGELPDPAGGTTPLRRLVVAQDTGSAIVGAARGDLFFGTGEEAGMRAGLVRNRVRFVVLKPHAGPDNAPAAR